MGAAVLKTAIELLQKHRLDEAQRVLQELLATQPQHAQARRLLAITLARQGKTAKAETEFQAVIQLDPANAEFWRDYAICLQQQNRVEDAHRAILQARRLSPQNRSLLRDCARIEYAAGRLKNALSSLQSALQGEPDNPEIHFEIGVVLHELGRLEPALEHLQFCSKRTSQHAACWSHMGGVYFKLLRLDEAETAFRNELRMTPNSIQTRLHLGNVLLKKEAYSSALEQYQAALALDTSRAESWFNVGNAQSRIYALQEAKTSLLKCLQLEPEHRPALVELAGVYLAEGEIEESIEHYRRACQFSSKPTDYSNYLYAWHFLDPQDRAGEFREHSKFAQQYALPKRNSPPAIGTGRRRIRVGYVSPDFRKHSVTYFLEPIVDHYDRSEFEFLCYHVGSSEDAVTHRLKGKVDQWVPAARYSNEELAEVVDRDQLDILVDLAGHTGHNRLPMFTARPAGVQMTFLGYSGSTGLKEIDYLLTDICANPPESQTYCSERLIYLPHSYFCYCPPPDAPAVSAVPAERQPGITFGCFNNRSKLGPTILEAWSRILNCIDNSTLLLKNPSLTDSAVREHLFRFFRQRGIAPERIMMHRQQPSTAQHLAMYHQVDIALDSYPYNGATTTCEALWMGVPVVSLAGTSHVSRMGLSILSAAGLDQLVASSIEAYIDTCIQWSDSIARLCELRRGLREQMRASPLMDEVGYTRALESIYRRVAR